jgi:hypothetical protein
LPQIAEIATEIFVFASLRVLPQIARITTDFYKPDGFFCHRLCEFSQILSLRLILPDFARLEMIGFWGLTGGVAANLVCLKMILIMV